MLRFRLEPLYVPSLERHFLPLPKLGASQLALLSAHLEAKGFRVRLGRGPSRRIATRRSQRIAIDGKLGLASSGTDMLDAVGPAIPELLASRSNSPLKADITALYLSLRSSGSSSRLRFFPRLESLRIWTCLRKDGLCGLTPDEHSALKGVLKNATSTSKVECVTAWPTEASSSFQVGGKVYFRSLLPVSEFLSSLRTIGSRADSASYLPRDSAIELQDCEVDARLSLDDLGEWCCVG